MCRAERNIMIKAKLSRVTNRIEVSIPAKLVKQFAEQHPDLYDSEEDSDIPYIEISNLNVFLDDVADELKSEAEDGSNLITEMFDKAILNAIENGSQGIKYT